MPAPSSHGRRRRLRSRSPVATPRAATGRRSAIASRTRVASSTPPAAASNGTSKRYEGSETDRPAKTEPGGESSAPVRRTTTSATAAAASRATSSHSRRHAGGCAERQLAPFPADLPAQRATSGDEEGERSDEHPACQCDQRRAREVAGLGLPQLAGAEDRESAEKPGDHAERRSRARNGERPVAEDAHEMAAVRAAQAEHGLLAPLCRGEHAAGVGRKQSRQEDRRQSEEEEHPLADRGVRARDHERVRDVVDEVVLPGSDALDGAGDGQRLRMRGGGRGMQPCALHEDVDLLGGQALDHAAELRTRGAHGRDHAVREHGGADDDRLRHVEELLERA